MLVQNVLYTVEPLTTDSLNSGQHALYWQPLKYSHLDIPAIWFGTEYWLKVYCTKLTLNLVRPLAIPYI